MDSDQGKLFIGGISWETTEEKLKEHFGSYGDVAEAVIMKDRTTGRARGFGFVVFADPAVADRALLEKHSIDGRVVEAKKAVPRDEQQNPMRSNNAGPRTKKIFVGGLASTVTEDDFKKYFGQFGNITDAVVMYDHNTQRPRGFGFITFDSEDAVDNVLHKTYHELNEKMVEVKPAVPKELSAPGGRNSGGGFGVGAGRGGSLNGGYGQGYSSNPGNTYGGGRMDNRYVTPPAGRGGYPSYGPGSYGAAPYGSGGGYAPAMNGGYGATGYPGGGGYGGAGSYGGGYGSTPAATGYGGAGGYGAPAVSGGYGSAPVGPRSPWGGAGGGYSSGGSPAGFGANSGSMGAYGSGGWGSGAAAAQANTGYGAGNYGYGGGEAGYGSSATGYGARGGGSHGTGPTGGASGYGDSYGASGYQETGWRSGADSHSSPAAGSGPGAAAGYGIGGGPAAEGYGAAGRQTQRGPDARFRPYPATAERAS